MSDQPPAANTGADAAAVHQKKTPSQIAESDYDQAQLQTVRNGEDLAHAAQDSAYNGQLLDEGMRTTAPEEFLAAGQDWRTLSREALEATDDREEITQGGKTAAEIIRATVEYLRSKCRLQITQNPAWTVAEKSAFRKRYFIGEDIFANEATAGQSIQTILDHAVPDKLPGITAAKLATYDQQLTAFTGKPSKQSGKQSIATTKRSARDKKFEEVMTLRHEIQHAADGAYPWSDPLNAGPRVLFKLPAGRPFTG